ncbi:alpha/beta fold hydrolase [Salinarimonas ramus]|uniref:AB hydrolase superfamily protein YclE n=1 Tax=Salinarimonas ramus TaxID=690164 RepID=A0A917Q4M5_9HYPH|nr:alpha/beta hydrolase [Salinarimonas ramus]GGK22535.1 AB hydrolase superfamily protein YclE [Salinarimonas ramus]
MSMTNDTRAPDGRSGVLAVGARRLAWTIEGEGPPILVPGSALYYPRVLSPALRRRHRLVFLDHRGFAPLSEGAAEEPVDLDRIVADIEAMRAEIGVERAMILGHSGHAYMALAYAARHPERISGVVLVAAGPSHAPAHMAMAERRWAELVAPARKARFEADMAGLADAIARDPDRRFVALCLALRARMWADPGFDAAPLWEGVRTDMRVVDALWGEAFAAIDTAAHLRAIPAPILLVLGAHDYAVAPPETWEPYRGHARDLEVRVLEGSGHTPMLEEPEAFDAVLQAWARRVGTAR